MKTSSVLKLLGAMVVVSGVTAVATFKVMEGRMVNSLAQQDSSISLTPTGFFTTSTGSVTDNDFTRAAEKTVNAVVGITNKQVRQTQSFGGMNDPFFDFFFGQRGQRQQEPQSSDPMPVVLVRVSSSRATDISSPTIT